MFPGGVMKRLIAESYLFLIRIEFLMRFGDLESIHTLVRKWEIRNAKSQTLPSVPNLCHAIDLACVLYLKPVHCLQRSAATTMLLREYGHKAEMVIGAQVFPFRSHAWVEVDGAIVNDKPYMLDIYHVLERC
jgi:hypothetical protein